MKICFSAFALALLLAVACLAQDVTGSIAGTVTDAGPPPVIPSGETGNTVLVVDDEDMVRRIAQASLEMRGYSVVVATNGLEALREVRKNSSIGVVLLDLTMPVMSGEEAIDEILAARPGIKVIVSTGYDHREAIARFSNKPVAGYLQKPYTSRQLAEKVKTVLKPRK